MKFDLKSPCANCPFTRRDEAVTLRAGRIREIHNVVTASQGGSFPCHRSVRDEDRNEEEDGDEDEWVGPKPHWQWCAGALIYALKQDRPNQLMRIGMRLGLLNPDEMLASPNADDVFISRADWMTTAVDYEEDKERRDEIETCSVVEAGCEAPAGYLSDDGVVDGEESADYECYRCGQPVCGVCSEPDGDERICVSCKEEQDEEAEMKKKAAAQRAKQKPETRKEWERLRKRGVTKFRCGHWSRRTRLGCARPQGHKGKHDFMIEQEPA